MGNYRPMASLRAALLLSSQGKAEKEMDAYTLTVSIEDDRCRLTVRIDNRKPHVDELSTFEETEQELIKCGLCDIGWMPMEK